MNPIALKKIVSFVGQMMLENDQIDLLNENGLVPFDLLVLEPVRTICEKIMSLVRFSYGEDPIEDLKKKIRRTYDLHQLLKNESYSLIFYSSDFYDMLLKVANDDVVSFRNNNKWLAYHPSEALIFKDLDNVWEKLRTTYSGNFKDLVYGEFPGEADILNTLKIIQRRLEKITWAIKIDT